MPPLCCLNPGLSRLVKMSCCPVICKETGRVIWHSCRFDDLEQKIQSYKRETRESFPILSEGINPVRIIYM